MSLIAVLNQLLYGQSHEIYCSWLTIVLVRRTKAQYARTTLYRTTRPKRTEHDHKAGTVDPHDVAVVVDAIKQQRIEILRDVRRVVDTQRQIVRQSSTVRCRDAEQ